MNLLRSITILISIIFIQGIAVAQSNQNVEPSNKIDSDAKSDTLTFTVYGMDCPGCEGGLEKQVKKIPSVSYARANWVNQELRIVIEQDSILDMQELERRVKKANFTLAIENTGKGQ